MTSTWMTRAPASNTSFTCAPRREKSADRIEGATRSSRSSGDACDGTSGLSRDWRTPLDRPQHASLAVVAGDDGGGRHSHDRGMLTAVRAHRYEFVSLQAVHTAVAAGHGSGTEPRLATSRALRAQLDGMFRHTPRLTVGADLSFSGGCSWGLAVALAFFSALVSQVGGVGLTAWHRVGGIWDSMGGPGASSGGVRRA
jgi:hypothetical protein